MKAFRLRLVVGQHIRTRDGTVEGIIDAAWPVENGTEALVRSSAKAKGEHRLTRVFFPAEITPHPRTLRLGSETEKTIVGFVIP